MADAGRRGSPQRPFLLERPGTSSALASGISPKSIPLRGLLISVNDRRLHLESALSGLYQTSGRCGLPYGLHGSLCTLQTFRSVRLSTLLLRICNTRYGRLVRPYPAGTLTLQEAPSLSWRTRCCPSPADDEVSRPRAGAIGLGDRFIRWNLRFGALLGDKQVSWIYMTTT
jgi:hypothetical protein